MVAKYGKAAQTSVRSTAKKAKAGKSTSGRSVKKVTSRKVGAIGLSGARKKAIKAPAKKR